MTTKTKVSVFVIAILALFATILGGILFFQKQQSGSVDTTDVSSAPEIGMPEGDSEGDFYTSDGVRIHYWYYNRGTSIVTIFLHGGPGGSTSDLRNTGQATAYADTFGSLLAFDQRGGGQSEKNADLAPTITYPRFIQDINELRSALIPGHEVVIFGRSFGGPLAARYADSHPEGVRGYILAAPGPFVANKEILDEQRAALLSTISADEMTRIAARDREIVLRLAKERGTLEHETSLILPGEDSDLDVGSAFSTYGGYFTEDEYHRLSALTDVPTLIEYGAYDTQVPPLSIEAMKPYLPQATFLELAGGHGAAYTHEEEFFAGVQKLFDSIKNNL